MSDTSTKTMLKPFIEKAPDSLFLSGFFKSPPENFHTSESVEIDIQRDGEDVAVPVTDIATGSRFNASTKGSNKEFVPPVFRERFVISAHKLMAREFGENPFQDLAFQARATIRAARESQKGISKIRRTVEWQAAQVLQSGAITLVDENGLEAYSINYSPKVAHFAPVTIPWVVGGATGNPFGDIQSRAATLRKNGHRNPNVLVFGGNAWNLFLEYSTVREALRRDGLGLGALMPQRNGADSATMMGTVVIGPYRYELWAYDGTFVHPQTQEVETYVSPDKLIMLSSQARLDLSFGAIPRFVPPDARVASFLPRRVSDSDRSIDVNVNGWFEPNGHSMSLECSARPLAIATEIDSFGCMDVTGA